MTEQRGADARLQGDLLSRDPTVPPSFTARLFVYPQRGLRKKERADTVGRQDTSE